MMNIELLLDKFEQFYDKYQRVSDRFDHSSHSYNEERVKLRAEYHDFLRKTDYLTVEEFNNFDSKYYGKKPREFTRFGPVDQPDGYYKVRFLGRISNPATNFRGFLPTSVYFRYKLKQILWWNTRGWGGFVDFSLIGIIMAILTSILIFAASVLIMLSFTILLTIVQFIVSHTASKG